MSIAFVALTFFIRFSNNWIIAGNYWMAQRYRVNSLICCFLCVKNPCLIETRDGFRFLMRQPRYSFAAVPADGWPFLREVRQPTQIQWQITSWNDHISGYLFLVDHKWMETMNDAHFISTFLCVHFDRYLSAWICIFWSLFLVRPLHRIGNANTDIIDFANIIFKAVSVNEENGSGYA